MSQALHSSWQKAVQFSWYESHDQHLRVSSEPPALSPARPWAHLLLSWAERNCVWTEQAGQWGSDPGGLVLKLGTRQEMDKPSFHWHLVSSSLLGKLCFLFTKTQTSSGQCPWQGPGWSDPCSSSWLWCAEAAAICAKFDPKPFWPPLVIWKSINIVLD